MGTYITSAYYGDIRVALGLEPDDTTTVSDSLIERRRFLPRAETSMTAVLSDCAVVFATTTAANQALVREAVVLWVASMLASGYFARKQGSQVKSQSVGPYSITYEGGQDWGQTGSSLLYDAAATMNDVCEDAVLAICGGFFATVTDWSDSEPGDDTDDI